MRERRYPAAKLVMLILILALGSAIIALGLRAQRAELENGALWRTDLEEAVESDGLPPVTECPLPGTEDGPIDANAGEEGGIGRGKTGWKIASLSHCSPSNE